MSDGTDATRNFFNITVSIASLIIAGSSVWSAIQIQRFSDTTGVYISELRHQQHDAQLLTQTLSESCLYVLATNLEKKHVLSAVDAQKIRQEALSEIQKQPGRWGKAIEGIAVSVEKEIDKNWKE
jgi:hypothetical protein